MTFRSDFRTTESSPGFSDVLSAAQGDNGLGGGGYDDDVITRVWCFGC